MVRLIAARRARPPRLPTDSLGCMDIPAAAGEHLSVMKAARVFCLFGAHKWHRFRREGLDMRECLRCGYVVRHDADPPRMMGADGGL